MDTYVKDEPGPLMFPGVKGGPIRRSGFNSRPRWVNVVTEMGLSGLCSHDLRYTGNVPASAVERGAGSLAAFRAFREELPRAGNRAWSLR